MKIKDIKNIETNETRTDGRYPLRIGSTIDFYANPSIGFPMLLSYIADNQGNAKTGVLRTSLIDSIDETDTEIIVKMINSIYYLEK